MTTEKKTILTIRGEKMEDSIDFVRFFKGFEGRKVLIYDAGFSQLSRGRSKTAYVRVREIEAPEWMTEFEAELYDDPLFSCDGCVSIGPLTPEECVIETCPQWKGVRWLKRVRDFIGNLHNDVAELTAVVKDMKAEIDRTIQTYEGMVEVRELVIVNHLNKLKALNTVLKEDWDEMNVAYNQDDKNRRHPRWKLREILGVDEE